MFSAAAIWLPITIISYLFLSISGAFDKFIVGREVKNPAVISFYVALLGLGSFWMVAVAFLPVPFAKEFAFSWPSLQYLVIILIAGILLQAALFFGYVALQKDEATRVISAMGATNPIFTLVFAYFILNETLKPAYYLAFIFLLLGAVVISVHRKKAIGPSFGFAVLAAATSAMQAVLTKLVYAHHPFIPSFILLTLGGAIYALIIFCCSGAVRRDVAASIHAMTRHPKLLNQVGAINPKAWILVSSGAGSFGVMGINIAYNLGPATLVNAMRGVQYAGIFIISLLLGRRFPKLLNEELSAQSIEQKIVAIALITIGIIILTTAK